jgi:predicted transposase/invertase (TIGR01784 family)
MRTDSLFYRLFQTAPEIFFELIGEPSTAAIGYEFQSVELKESSFRIDGVLLADEGRPVYFSEVQFQKDEVLYRRFFAEIFLYLRQYVTVSDWRGVLIYPQQSLEPTDLGAYRELLAGNRVTRIYLDRLGDAAELPLASSLVKLVVEPEATAPALARELIGRSGQESLGRLSGQDLIRLVETIIVYKFSTLSREEIEMMLGLADLKQTRVYQEGREEGEQIGEQRGQQIGEQRGLRMARRLVRVFLTARFGVLPPELIQQLEAVEDLERLEQLGSAAVSVESLAEFSSILAQGQEQPELGENRSDV